MITLTETITENEKNLLPKLYKGIHTERLYNYLVEIDGKEAADNTFANGRRAMYYFSNPEVEETSKILCMGKVQSGKTGFFISSISMAFDNGYGICYLIGGTKNKLKKQNKKRAQEDFSADEDIIVIDINEAEKNDITNYLIQGKKIVLVVLKNNSLSKNLGKAKTIASSFSRIPSVVVDDEGDEASPGAPKKKKEAPTHKNMTDILKILKCYSYLIVTATPQANILLSTIDALSPDFIVLVKPGEKYTGGNSFHDVIDNPHVIEIADYEDFESKVPSSFLDSFYFYIFACCLKDDGKAYSMLVHPSHLKVVHNSVAKKISDIIKVLKESFNPENISYNNALAEIKAAADTYKLEYNLEKIISRIPEVMENLEVNIFNTSSLGIDEDDVSDKKYKIYVGGEMLGRGLTIERLIVTYIYRDSKESNIDTLYQRARWFGYKRDYFDVCRVYMPKLLIEKFKAITDCENDMWNSVNEFLKTKINFKEFPRLFQLNTKIENSKLNLTRKTVSNTVVVERINPGYSYNKGIMFNGDGRKEDRDLFNDFYSKHFKEAHDIICDTTGYQTHKFWNMNYKDLYDEFLSKYKFPYPGVEFGPLTFKRLLDGNENENVKVVVMRYNSKEYRAIDESGMSIKELPQSYNNNTNFEGDKRLFEDELSLQIHLVYQENENDYLPMLALNNPIKQRDINIVTGDNYYGN